VLANSVEIACAVLTAALALVVFLQVLNRYLFKAPLAWSEDLAMLLFQWVAFLGAAVGVRRAKHFGIEIAVRALPPRLHGWAARLVCVPVAAVAVVLVVQGWRLVSLNSARTFATMELSYRWSYLPLPVSGVLMLIFLVASEIQHYRARGSEVEGRP
jgi:TRAP-type C4-dicarboxylate transport system permease small subunit